MLELGLRDPGTLSRWISTSIFLKKLAFMLNVTSKSENETFLVTRISEFTEI